MPVELDGPQRVLHRALLALGPALATMYVGSLAVLADENNPDRLAHSAHSLRELIEKLPDYLDVPTKAQGEDLGAKVNDLQLVWERARKSNCHKAGLWSGSIDSALQLLLAGVGAFFEWRKKHMPSRKEEAALALRRLDASGRDLPAVLLDSKVKAWQAMRQFFLSVAHHGRSPEVEEFNNQVRAFERFLLDHLVPQTFEDFEEIDALLKGEGDA